MIKLVIDRFHNNSTIYSCPFSNTPEASTPCILLFNLQQYSSRSTVRATPASYVEAYEDQTPQTMNLGHDLKESKKLWLRVSPIQEFSQGFYRKGFTDSPQDFAKISEKRADHSSMSWWKRSKPSTKKILSSLRSNEPQQAQVTAPKSVAKTAM